MTRALFVAPNLETGGVERQWSTLLPGLHERGVQPVVLTLDGTGRFFEDLGGRGIHALCARFERRSDARAWRQALGFGAAAAPDVLVSQGESAIAVGDALRRRLHKPHVVALHGLHRPQTVVRRLIVRVASASADCGVVVTAAQVEFAEAVGFHKDRIRVIANGVAPPRVDGSPSALRAELGIGADAFVVAFIARLRPEKRATDFVHAVARARAQNESIVGVIVGDGPESELVRTTARQTGGAVHFLGARVDTSTVIAAADAICLTSATEAQPMTLLEAMALAKPVVASAVGGVPDLVVDGDTGLLVAPRDLDGFASAFLRLASDGELGGSLGAAGFARQRSLYSEGIMIDRYADLLTAFARPRGVSLPRRTAAGAGS